jgi:uncharacterized membrane protein YeaQ/YmgE (transglycosylase-associated protein family)
MTMGIWGAVIMIAFALVMGIVAQMYGAKHWTYEWLVTGFAALVGAFVASEYLGAFSAYGPQYDGLAIVPALIGAVVVGVLAHLFTRTAVNEPTA